MTRARLSHIIGRQLLYRYGRLDLRAFMERMQACNWN